MNTTLSSISEHEVKIPCAGVILTGDVAIPAGATGIVIFAHGSGSSRLSPRNRLVAGEIHRKGIATLLFDLLTPEEARSEARTGELRFNIPLLTERLLGATCWVREEPDLKDLGIGYFGASTGAAAALAAAASIPQVMAVVSRGGRTDLAGDLVKRVDAPTLLIVGGGDVPVLKWNRATLEELRGVKHLAVIPGASHLFEEAGTLEKAAEIAASWFELYLRNPEREMP